MSSREWRCALDLVASDVPFYALIMAAMMKAGGRELEELTDGFPGVAMEVEVRYGGQTGDVIEYGRP